MVLSELSGGLGNQFFRYAFARAYIEKRAKNDQLVLNYNQINHHGAAGDIENFNIMEHEKVVTDRLVFAKGSLKQKVVFALYGFEKRIMIKMGRKTERDVRHKWIPRLRNNGIILVRDLNEDYEIDTNSEKFFIFGTFENSKYFSSIRDILNKEFTPKEAPLPENSALYDIIKNRNSVCVCVRRGDYLKGANKDNYYVCDEDYYLHAISKMKEIVDNPVFMFFSNDIQWVKEKLAPSDCECYYESGNDPVWETFRLMYSCKHFIISNSTFHWWAQYMGSFPGKIVISPSKWYRNPNWKSHLIEPYFTTIDTIKG